MIILLSILTASAVALIMAVIFYLGLKTGKELAGIQKPVKQAKMSKSEKEEQAKVMEAFGNVWDNINNYDGTSESQKEVK